MTRKHFEAIAEQFRAEREALERGEYDFPEGPTSPRTVYRLALDSIEQRMANVCADHNPNFDRAKFLQACGLEFKPEVDA